MKRIKRSEKKSTNKTAVSPLRCSDQYVYLIKVRSTKSEEQNNSKQDWNRDSEITANKTLPRWTTTTIHKESITKKVKYDVH